MSKTVTVELYEESGIWYFKDSNNSPWSTSVSTNIIPMPVENNTNSIKKVIKLKEAGFSAEEIIDMVKAGVL